MSYSKRYRQTIAVHYSGSVSYPASEHGGSTSYSGTAYEEVVIDIDVDTNPFDREVRDCNMTVGNLTGAIVATETAQVASIYNNSRKIGGTIVKGFFDTVRSELSQQIMELTTKVDTTLLHLQKMAQRCKEKQLQMQNDYGRLTSRYLKTFDDLNNELENRIFELCRPAFIFKRTTDERTLAAICSDIATTAAISGAEQTRLEAQITSSLTKRRAVDTILQANHFLTKQKRTEYVLNHSAIDESAEGNIYLPVCYLETNDNGITNRHTFKHEMLDSVNATQLAECISQSGIQNELESENKQLEESFNRQVGSMFKGDDKHNKRVMNYVTNLFYSNIK